MYRFICSFSILILTTVGLNAQGPFVAKFSSSSGGKKVEIIVFDATLSVKGTNTSSVKVNATGMKPLPERARGLKPVSRTAVDNTGLGLEVKSFDNTITITQIASSELDIIIEIPKQASLMLEHTGRNAEQLTVDNVEGEMEISVNRSPLKITSVVGPVVANSTGGDIEVQFKKLSQEGPTSINTVSGFVDITLPQNAKANLELTTLSDDIFTDFEINLEDETQKDKKRKNNYNCGCSEKNIKGTINGGGVDLYLKSVRDNIYLRKG